MIFKEIYKKYPTNRDEMDEATERAFVNDCFEAYEKEGFTKRFWSPYEEYEEKIGECFEILGRCSTEDDKMDLCVLPMWNIKFQDGTIVGAYPEEIIPSEMKANGCPW